MVSARFKYNNIRVEIDGIKFDSKKEAKRYGELKLLERAGLIKDLQLQVAFELVPPQKGGMRKELAVKYIADFVYTENGQQVIEDTKGVKTKDYIIKRKLMKLMGREVREI
ncbi:uncharacterized protein DUF1064 [Methylovorus glucosotrophus]|uniref:DUF1064 domain-containing protein n=1 Tax=Methylovorus glucosotrophus TaxID=266009 RepID=UPI00133179CA|nr:DUF1064 domain-containing protein [Methylovorus glucosotrophus]KAF0844339.1 uncharacterized protein DUF1064 [Methylovorus glucosotrophus]